jgi:cobalt-zinc-cadmium resistance protein CzcA
MGHLMIIVPMTVGAIFFLLFLLFNSLAGQPDHPGAAFASVGGVIGLLSPASTCRCRPRWASSRCGASRCSTGWCWSATSASCAPRACRWRGGGAGRDQRFRPVMMTATVALLALILPVRHRAGLGGAAPLAIVVIGGLITSTLLTLVVPPTLYKWFDDTPYEA